jgi:glutamate synthase domain-containing protein 2/glutamate synthase domain-containing protein 1/glutamate synthase domain-containing protein 3
MRGGLYDPRFEHDGCGVAFVADIGGERSHEIVAKGIEALVNLGHRGASGWDPETGDGAGILVQLPDAFLRRVGPADLPSSYGVGMAFLPQDAADRARCELIIADACEREGVTLYGWRVVPVEPSAVGTAARAAMPRIAQFFVGANGLSGGALERRLYVLRRVIEVEAERHGVDRVHQFYLSSLSSRVLIYKGMLLAPQMVPFYPDLDEPDLVSAMALVHARFSTNVLPRWDLAQPLRYCAHNGEINTLSGNVGWMRARASKFRSPLFGSDIEKLGNVVDVLGSDSSQFDNALELLVAAGRPIEHAMVMMIPQAWERHAQMGAELRAFYEFHSSLLEPWDGPAAIAFTDGRVIGATLDRNGLRPARYVVTDDGLVVLSSEAGVLDLAPGRIVRSWRLEPGKLLLVDTVRGRIQSDRGCKEELANEHPYRRWIDQGTIRLDELKVPDTLTELDAASLLVRQQAFGYTEEELRMLLTPMARDAEEPVGSMGNDTPLAVLSDHDVPLFSYFKQLFAQVTNPPIDPIREQLVMSLGTSLGAGGNLLEQGPAQAQRLELPHPVLTNANMDTLRHVTQRAFPTATVRSTFPRRDGALGLAPALERLCAEASAALADGNTVLVVSDRSADAEHVAIPSLLATSAVHHHLLRERTRTGVGLVIESGEPREVMHVALLVGFGAEAVNPYLAFESARDLQRSGVLGSIGEPADAERNLVAAYCKGLLKTIAKMGISTISSYCGAKVFEAIGIADDVIEQWFPGTSSRIGGISLEVIATEALARHERAFPLRRTGEPTLELGGRYQWRRDEERHAWNPETIALLQHAVKRGDVALYREYARRVNDESHARQTLRGLLELRPAAEPVPLDEVEPVASIVRRFATGAMSLGSLSPEAHETIAIAMNRLGGRSNTGEGGEDARRYQPDENGDLRRSAIKQVASARFGVTAHYLVNADELQIKIAQGAKPGEGGQLPGYKVDDYIARLRHSTPGVGLISPPPHHDIYSIEDLAQLILDLKHVNPSARISVKLVAEVGVGTVAAGVAKARAEHIVVAGHDGGTGASPLSSIAHAGAPWELGLAEAQQVLIANGLRSRVVLQTDGQLKTGRDVLVAGLLGAEEFGFATAALVASGCIMMRACHLNTCPVGIATQDPVLRGRYEGRAENIVAFMEFLAHDVREWMAQLGFRTFDELVGRSDLLEAAPASEHWKAKGLDLTKLLWTPENSVERRHSRPQDHGLAAALDHQLVDLALPALEDGSPVCIELAVTNRHRCVGAMLSGAVARRHGVDGLPDDSIHVELEGTAGQSLGAWLAPGITLVVTGAANDHVGKGLSGGRVVVRPSPDVAYVPEENIIIGNVALYGATSGEAYLRGVAGERFAVRNSGATAVVEGVGDHGCEYMTGGTVVVLGRTGRNFAAGMSGGVAIVLAEGGSFAARCNPAMVELEEVGAELAGGLRVLVERHYVYTASGVARRLLDDWEGALAQFVAVVPNEYRGALARHQVLPHAATLSAPVGSAR